MGLLLTYGDLRCEDLGVDVQEVLLTIRGRRAAERKAVAMRRKTA